jgi:hypothetical protein
MDNSHTHTHDSVQSLTQHTMYNFRLCRWRINIEFLDRSSSSLITRLFQLIIQSALHRIVNFHDHFGPCNPELTSNAKSRSTESSRHCWNFEVWCSGGSNATSTRLRIHRVWTPSCPNTQPEAPAATGKPSCRHQFRAAGDIQLIVDVQPSSSYFHRVRAPSCPNTPPSAPAAVGTSSHRHFTHSS